MWGKSFFIISLVVVNAQRGTGSSSDPVFPGAPISAYQVANAPRTVSWLGYPQSESPKLPDNLTEVESRSILKERNGKPHVEAAIKVSEARLQNAVKLAEADQAEEAARELNLNVALFSYADSYARQLPPNEQKERNKCLKEIEQAIFKQQRLFEAARRDLPFNYREQTEGLVETLKRIRLRAINDLLGGGTIIK